MWSRSTQAVSSHSRIGGAHRASAVMTPALYRTRITHLRRAPVHHYFEHRSYSWYVDIDELPRLPRWLRPFARFEARTTSTANRQDTLRRRVDAFLAVERHRAARRQPDHRAAAGRACWARVQPADPVLVPRRRRGAAVTSSPRCTTPRRPTRLPAATRRAASPRWCMKQLYASPFNGRRRPLPVRRHGPTPTLDVRISLHRDNEPGIRRDTARHPAARHRRPRSSGCSWRAAGAVDERRSACGCRA